MRRTAPALALALSSLLWAVAPATAQAQPGGRGVSTMTRYVMEIGELERQLADARARGDAAVLDRLLSPVFEVRRADGQMQSREDWQAAGAHKSAAGVAGLAVHETGRIATASFRSRDAAGVDHFIVDLWMPQDDGRWQLRLRFDAPALPAPAAGTRPDGKR